MNGLSLKDSQHAPKGGQPNGFERSAYVPPHMRQRGGPPDGAAFDGPAPAGPPPAANGLNGSAWAPQK